MEEALKRSDEKVDSYSRKTDGKMESYTKKADERMDDFSRKQMRCWKSLCWLRTQLGARSKG